MKPSTTWSRTIATCRWCFRKLRSSEPKKHVFEEMRSMVKLALETDQESPRQKCFSTAKGLQQRLPKNACYDVPLISLRQIKRVLNEMTPDRCLMSQLQINFKEDVKKNPEQWNTERDTGCFYRAEKFSEDMLKSWTTSDPEIEKLFDWPKPNPFVPKDLTIKSRSSNISELPVVS